MLNQTATPPAQAQRRPLGSLNSAMRDLDLASTEVRALLDEGKLIGFDIGTGETGRTALRILSDSIEHYSTTRKPLMLVWPEIFNRIFPPAKLVVKSTELQRGLNCEQPLVRSLITGGFLQCVKKGGPGRGNCAMVTRASIETWLKGRQL